MFVTSDHWVKTHSPKLNLSRSPESGPQEGTLRETGTDYVGVPVLRSRVPRPDLW